ncbi:hypothetical protein ABLE68_12195 [Nocardioides sp. CN2-186]|uniref:hypothetical protein n=1 Tax=Nocardioides tweenelious TaxID=3156607 RepID=UPI0032B52132
MWRQSGVLVAVVALGAGCSGSGSDSDPGSALPSLVDGCPPGVYANTDFALDGDDGGRLRVCRFVAAGDPQDRAADVLADGRELSARESREVRKAVKTAPVVEKSQFRRCADDQDGDDREFYLVSTPDQVAFWVYNSVCGDHGVLTVDDRGRSVDRAVTAELLDALGSPRGPLRD